MDDRITIEINECEVEKVASVKSLGVYIDKHLNWSLHIEKISKKIASAIGALKRIRPYVTTDTAIQVYRALIQPYFDYCCSVWDGLNQTLNCKIQKLQNWAARIVMQGVIMPVRVHSLMCCTGIISPCVGKNPRLI